MGDDAHARDMRQALAASTGSEEERKALLADVRDLLQSGRTSVAFFVTPECTGEPTFLPETLTVGQRYFTRPTRAMAGLRAVRTAPATLLLIEAGGETLECDFREPVHSGPLSPVPKRSLPKYTAVANAKLRAGAEQTSRDMGSLAAGTTIAAIETRTVNGRVRIRCRQGWVSEKAEDGTALLEPFGPSPQPAGTTAAVEPAPAPAPSFALKWGRKRGASAPEQGPKRPAAEPAAELVLNHELEMANLELMRRRRELRDHQDRLSEAEMLLADKEALTEKHRELVASSETMKQLHAEQLDALRTDLAEQEVARAAAVREKAELQDKARAHISGMKARHEEVVKQHIASERAKHEQALLALQEQADTRIAAVQQEHQVALIAARGDTAQNAVSAFFDNDAPQADPGETGGADTSTVAAAAAEVAVAAAAWEEAAAAGGRT
jgi:hypothetical protein